MTLSDWTPRDRKLYEKLMSHTCQCGMAKEARNSFCRNCYYHLPREMRKQLYRAIGDGYAKAYDDAVAHLDQRGNQ